MVQATVNEPLDLLVAFVSHYLEMGAEEVHLYLDKPHPEAEALFAGHPKVKLTRCDGDYWAVVSPKGRPMGHPARQMMNAKHQYQDLTYDWLLMCDADEYVLSKQDLGTVLAAVPARIDFVRVRVAERVLPPGLVPRTIFEGCFRLPKIKGKAFAAQIYGEEIAPLLERVVAGHDIGKSIIRRGGDFALNLHTATARQPRRGEVKPPPEPVAGWLSDVYLAHFDALTPLHYLIKLLGKYVAKRAMENAGRKPGPRHPSRELQIELAAKACADPDPVSKTAVLHRMTPTAMDALKKHDLLVELDLAPDRTARKHFPQVPLDFTPEAFDRALRIKHAATFDEMGII